MRAWLLLSWLALVSCETDKNQAPPAKVINADALKTFSPATSKQSLSDGELHRLARNPGPQGRQHLRRLLGGQSNERRWAAFGLGLNCYSAPDENDLNFLVAAMASWAAEKTPPSPELLGTTGWAIGACAAEKSEDILRGFLSPDPSVSLPGLIDAGVLGLAALADRRGSLSERTQTALLDAATREGRAEVLLPLGRIGRLSEAVGAHILEVAGTLLTSERTEGRRKAIFALGSAGPSAAAPLAQVLLAETFTPEQRSAAAQALGRLGPAGQKALDQTLSDILARGLPIEFDRPLWMPLRATMRALRSATKSKSHLRELSSVVLSEGDGREKAAQRRRMIWLRCHAAEILAQDRYETTSLKKCDPSNGREGTLALLRSVERAPLKNKRLEKFLELTKSADPVVVQTALRLIPSHPELESGDTLLLDALKNGPPGTQATAAKIISAYPARALPKRDKGKSDLTRSDDALIQTLKELLDADATELPVETRAAALQATGALQALSLKSQVEKFCDGDVESLWGPAERTLQLLGDPKKSCRGTDANKALLSAPSPFGKSQSITITIDSDVGPLMLHLDNHAAPGSTTRFLDLIEEKFYDGIEIHGGRPGFAVQFGDKDGDGYDDSLRPPLTHEISPDPFTSLSFGMSAFSPGSQNSQIFVTISDAPQLTGSRVRLGRAEGPWHLLTVGDVLYSVKR